MLPAQCDENIFFMTKRRHKDSNYMRIQKALLLLALACSCSPKIVERVVTEYRTEYRDRIIHDTATFEIPVEVEKIVTRDTVSHLENKYAASDAVVSGGYLSHSLESKPQTIYVPYEVTVTDTLIVEKEVTTAVETKEVEKKLSWWQKVRLWAFLPLLLLCLWAYRKQILGLIRKIPL